MPQMQRFEKALVNSPIVTFWHRDVLQKRMLRLARRPVEGPLLDLGIGQGATTEGLLRRLPGLDVTGLDCDADELARARRRLGSRATLVQGDATRLQFDDRTFGTVVEMNAFHHVPAWGDALREAHRVLRPGGQLLFTDYTRDVAGGLFANDTFQPGAFTRDEFVSALQQAGFARVVVEGRWIIVGRADKA